MELKIEWHQDGLLSALGRKEIVVIVDALRFSSTVTVAVANNYEVLPTNDKQKGQLSLSPIGYQQNEIMKSGYLYSSNGATLSQMIGISAIAYIGSFLNAVAIAKQIDTQAKALHKSVSLIAAGEQPTREVGGQIEYIATANRVFAPEDYLACGAICRYSSLRKSKEAREAEESFENSKDRLAQYLRETDSGRYLTQTGRKREIDFVSRINEYDVVPMFSRGKIVGMSRHSDL